MVDFIAGTIGALPGYRLVLGTSVELVPEAIAALLGQEVEGPKAVALPDKAPLVSVVIPVRNGAHFIADCVASILAQAYPKVEIIIVDDESTDLLDTAIAALPVQVRNIRIAHSGAAAARNVGAIAASGDIIAFLDVDDAWPDGGLAAMLAHLTANPDTDVAIGRGQFFEVISGDRRLLGSPAETFPLLIGAALFRRTALDKVGTFDRALRYAEDIDWFARARDAGVKMDQLDMVTLHVRRHESNSTAGKTAIELLPLQLARNALRRKRAVAG
jgi:glycosyltransferase involved in cell wall biosynthesis